MVKVYSSIQSLSSIPSHLFRSERYLIHRIAPVALAPLSYVVPDSDDTNTFNARTQFLDGSVTGLPGFSVDRLCQTVNLIQASSLKNCGQTVYPYCSEFTVIVNPSPEFAWYSIKLAIFWDSFLPRGNVMAHPTSELQQWAVSQLEEMISAEAERLSSK